MGLGSESAQAAAAPLRAARRPATVLDFDAIGKSLADAVRTAQGYTATVLYATGDALHPDLPAWHTDGSETDYDRRAGDHHDGMSFFGLRAGLRGQDGRDPNSSQRGLLVVNHENATGTSQFLHPAGEAHNSAGAPPCPESEVVKEQDAHGVSIIELRMTAALHHHGFQRHQQAAAHQAEAEQLFLPRWRAQPAYHRNSLTLPTAAAALGAAVNRPVVGVGPRPGPPAPT